MYDGIILGSVERFTITMQPFGKSTLHSCPWSLVIHSQKSITIGKSDCIYINDNTYDFILDTSLIGVGSIDMRLVIDIADTNAPEDQRRIILQLPISTKIIR